MKTTLDMKTIHNMNLFERITQVKAKSCFDYNIHRVFVVPRKFLKRSLGDNNKNLPRIEQNIGKKIRIIAEPERNNQEEIQRFVKAIVFPHEFKRVEITLTETHEPEVQVFSLPKNKAILIGRNKQRLIELSQAIDQFFGIKKVVIK